MKLTIAVLTLSLAACKTSDTTTNADSSQAARATQDYTVIANDAVLQRIIAKDPTLKDSDIPALYAHAANNPFVQGMETKHNDWWDVPFKSKDAKYFGVAMKWGKLVRVLVFADPTAKEIADEKESRDSTGYRACFVNVAVYPNTEEGKSTFSDILSSSQMEGVKADIPKRPVGTNCPE